MGGRSIIASICTAPAEKDALLMHHFLGQGRVSTHVVNIYLELLQL